MYGGLQTCIFCGVYQVLSISQPFGVVGDWAINNFCSALPLRGWWCSVLSQAGAGMSVKIIFPRETDEMSVPDSRMSVHKICKMVLLITKLNPILRRFIKLNKTIPADFFVPETG